MLNLVKRKEKKPRESILANELTNSLRYLNQFLPAPQRIIQIAWDMARCAKSRDGNVLQTLDEIAQLAMRETGFFHAGPRLAGNILRPGIPADAVGGVDYSSDRPGRLQVG